MKQPKFEIGDRVTYASPQLPYQKKRGIGKVVWEMATHYYIVWENFPNMECPHLKEWQLGEDDMLMLVKVSGKSETLKPSKTDNLPEIAHDLHGYFEHYQPVIKGVRSYWYRRYVYVDISGKLRHHHVPEKQRESIETLWRSGATAKEICTALGKTYLGKSSK